MKGALQKISIEGFKSIREMKDFELKNLNVIIGGNGADKSNFIQIFRMLMAMTQKNFSKFILERGGADNFLFQGPKVTAAIKAKFVFNSHSPFAKGPNEYSFEMSPTADEKFLISEWREYVTTSKRSYGTPAEESRLQEQKDEKSHDGQWDGVGHFVYRSIAHWMVYHFHDTGDKAPMRRSEIVEDHKVLRSDAANIAPFLLNLKNSQAPQYQEIVQAVRLVIPFFDDFRLDVLQMGSDFPIRLTLQIYPPEAQPKSDGPNYQKFWQ